MQNFSYVFQASGSGSKAITREEMRAFKKVWAEFADPKTGYLLEPELSVGFSGGEWHDNFGGNGALH